MVRTIVPLICLLGHWIVPATVFGGRPGTHTLAFSQVPVRTGRADIPGIAKTVLSNQYSAGSRVLVADIVDVTGSFHVISDGFETATDPSFSFDGARLVFAGRKTPNDPLQIWETDLSAVSPRQRFSSPGDCVRPAYLPDGGIVFASPANREYEEHGGLYSLSLYRIGPGETSPTRISFSPSSEIDPVVLPDGRILFSSWQHVGTDGWPMGTFSLMTVNTDGTGIWGLTGHRQGPWLKRGPALLEGDRIGFIGAERILPFGSGSLLVTSLNDPLAPYETQVDQSGALVADVAAGPDGDIVVSALPRDGGTVSFGLHRLGPDRLTVLYDDPAFHEIRPAVYFQRPLPPRRVSVTDNAQDIAWLAALNCYESDIPGRRPPEAGRIAAVRVLAGSPIQDRNAETRAFLTSPEGPDEPALRPSSATGGIPVRILGEAPVEPDGSLYVKVPADVPLRLQLLGRDGFSLIDQRAWFWLRPGERRVCIGCHENREMAPPNLMVEAVRKPPVNLADPAGWRTVSFRRDIEQGIISTTCSAKGCHRPPEPTAGMNLSRERMPAEGDGPLARWFGPAYANLLRRRANKPFAVGSRLVHPGDARNSPLLWMLYGRRLGEQYVPAPFERPLIEPHPDGRLLDDATLTLFKTWIDLGAQYDDDCPAGEWPWPDARSPQDDSATTARETTPHHAN